MAGWRGNGRQTTRTVYGPHPWSIDALGMDALYAADYGAQSSMDRREDNSPHNGTRFMGDLGPLQRFESVAASSHGRLPVQPQHLPSTSGPPSNGNRVLDLLANTSPAGVA